MTLVYDGRRRQTAAAAAATVSRSNQFLIVPTSLTQCYVRVARSWKT